MAPNTTQVCDNCRLRKTKCDRGNPCSCCVAYVIPCTYKHSPQRRGPKGGKGKRLTMIKLGLATQPSSPVSPSTSPDNIVPPPSAPLGPASLFPCSLDKLSTIVAAHVHIFMARIFPIMPVVDAPALLRDAAQIGSLSAARYAVLISLVATTRIQLKLDEDRALESTLLEPDDTVSREISGTQLLAAAEAAHQQSNVVDNMSLDSVLTCFFLFTANGNLERHGKAWFYLGQAISVGSIIGINRNDISGRVPLEEVETRRALFWLIFISERTYALQQRHPILLRGKVPKPSVSASSHPLIMNDFVNHSRLFEGLPENMYEWDAEQGDTSAEAARSHETITSAICAVEPSNSMIESQQFDTLVTQQWLRIAIWRLAYGAAPADTKLPSLTIPFDAGKAIMTALNSVSQHSKDCHGISIVRIPCLHPL